MTCEGKEVIVIGAGPAGCAAAYNLSQKGHRVTLLEKEAAIGGRTRTHRDENFKLDTGAAFITNFYPRIFALAKELGFESSIAELSRISGLHYEGRTAELNISSTASFLAFPFLGMLDKLKMGKWTAGLTLKRKQFDIGDPQTLQHFDARSVGEHARTHLNEKIYDFLIRPGIEPFWYFSCEEVSEGLALGLSAHAAGAKFYYFQEGIDEVCQKLTRQIQVQCNATVSQVTYTAGKFQVTVKGPQGEESLEADRLVLATTATVANRITSQLPTQLVSDNQRAFLQSQNYVANIHLAYKVPRLQKAPPMSSIFPCGPGNHALAALSFNRIKDPQRDTREHELISLYLSGEESTKYLEQPDEKIYERGIELAREFYPDINAQAEPYYIIRRPEAIPVHAVGRYRLAHAFQQEQKARGGPVFFCGDYLATATIDGAVATGLSVG
ncbi:MAG: hypothetical protein CMH56_01190 [Myxococcales bacterium]|nr:hypothetical protein [Myxococcales bacterium]